MDKEKVIGHLNDCMEASRLDNTWLFVRKDIVEDAIAMLKQQETVVRCADCRHADISPSGLIKCRGIFRSREWYCADGERCEVNDSD